MSPSTTTTSMQQSLLSSLMRVLRQGLLLVMLHGLEVLLATLHGQEALLAIPHGQEGPPATIHGRGIGVQRLVIGQQPG